MDNLENAQVLHDDDGSQPSGREVTPLIDEFYDSENDGVFDEWYGDAVTDHEKLALAVIKSKLIVIRGIRRRMNAQAQRGDWDYHAESAAKLAERQREFGKYMFDLINDYMEEASERCK